MQGTAKEALWNAYVSILPQHIPRYCREFTKSFKCMLFLQMRIRIISSYGNGYKLILQLIENEFNLNYPCPEITYSYFQLSTILQYIQQYIIQSLPATISSMVPNCPAFHGLLALNVPPQLSLFYMYYGMAANPFCICMNSNSKFFEDINIIMQNCP